MSVCEEGLPGEEAHGLGLKEGGKIWLYVHMAKSFLQVGKAAALTRTFLLFSHPLQCVSPVLRCSAASFI